MGNFTTNWYMYRVCLPAISKDSEAYTPLEPQNRRVNELSGKKPQRADAVKREKSRVCEQNGLMVSNLKISDYSKKDFNEIFLEAVDEALAILGDSCRQAVYLHIEKTFKIKRRDIPLKIADFVQAIENIFGVGAELIEIQIMKNLRKKIKQLKYFPNEKLTFTEYVKAAKHSHIHRKPQLIQTVKAKRKQQTH